MDHLGEHNDLTPRIRVGPDQPVTPGVVFGLDTRLFLRGGEEGLDWEAMGGTGRHEDEVEVRSVWRGGKRGKGKRRADGHAHEHGDCRDCDSEEEDGEEVEPVERQVLEKALGELNFEIYRGTYTPSSSSSGATAS